MSVAFAQKGSWYVGGNAGFEQTKATSTIGGISRDGKKESRWSFSPEVGKFLTNQIQLGAGFTVNGAKYDDNTNPASTGKVTNFGGVLYSRYFFKSGAFRPFLGLNVSLQQGKGESTFGGGTFKTTSSTFGSNLNAGFAFALSSKVTTLGSFGFLGFVRQSAAPQQSKDKNTITKIGFDAGSLGNRFNIGIYYTL
jgi:hypothetical protein